MVPYGGELRFSKKFSSPAVKHGLMRFSTIWDGQCLEDSEPKEDLINELIRDEGFHRNAPATQGLLNIYLYRDNLK